ncbi:MAG: V-type ATP synthase subunit D [Spirochaetes bacterium]|nr:V-type ATP synthase subunit D [Spirochaetota bacterium]
MKLEVSATRMELLKLKKRLMLARRGHKLLKDKQDELMRNFLELVNKDKELRVDLDKEMIRFYENYYSTTVEYDPKQVQSMFLLSNSTIRIEREFEHVMNLRLPKFNVNIEGEIHSFGYKDVDIDFDIHLSKLRDLSIRLIELARIENSIKELALEIEKTRRRVNALEYILIPNLEETIKYIGMKIGEVERSNLTRLMKVKEIVERH